MMDEQNDFGVVDYCVFAAMLVFSAAIGLYISFKGNKTPEEFFMGNRSMKPIPVSMSLLTSYISATTILGYVGEVYGNGMQICTIALGCTAAIIFSSYFILPILFPLKLTSINEYIELRFKNKQLRFALFLAKFIKSLVMGGITLYSPTIALSVVTNLSTLTSILILGIICTIYSSFGGIKAVVWTDVFQFSVIIIGMVTVVTVGCAQNGGFIETLHIASQGGRLEVFNMSLSPFVRHTFLNCFAVGFFFTLQIYCSEQVNLQRICSVKSIKNAKSVLKFNLYGKLVVYFLTFTCGLVAYASYVGCDPMALGIIKKKDEIMTYFIGNKLSFIPGLPGLFIATIIGGVLSTLSSALNACVALLWKDVFQNFKFIKDSSQFYKTLFNKLISVVIGTVIIGVAILASSTKGVMEMAFIVSAAISGPIFGIFLIGFFLPQCNLKGLWTGFIGSYALMLWLVIGGLLNKKPTKMLPFSAVKCVNLNFSSLSNNSVQETISSTYINNITESNDDTSIFNSFYQISYTLYSMIGPLSCIILAVIVSCITGNQKSKDVSPKYVSQYVHKFFWTKEELKTIRENEINLGTLISKDKKIEAEDNPNEISDNILYSN